MDTTCIQKPVYDVSMYDEIKINDFEFFEVIKIEIIKGGIVFYGFINMGTDYCDRTYLSDDVVEVKYNRYRK